MRCSRSYTLPEGQGAKAAEQPPFGVSPIMSWVGISLAVALRIVELDMLTSAFTMGSRRTAVFEAATTTIERAVVARADLAQIHAASP